jgi:hypothetical protein
MTKVDTKNTIRVGKNFKYFHSFGYIITRPIEGTHHLGYEVPKRNNISPESRSNGLAFINPPKKRGRGIGAAGSSARAVSRQATFHTFSYVNIYLPFPLATR